MILTIIFEENIPISLDLSEDVTVETVREIVLAEIRISVDIQMFHNGKILSTGDLRSYDVKNGDIITISRVNAFNNASSHALSSPVSFHDLPVDITPETLIRMSLENPMLLEQIARSNPALGESIKNNNIPVIRKYLMSRYLTQHKKVYENQLEMNRISANPDSEENQRKIAEKIQEENIRENMELALENIPESFSQVNMLYIDCHINDIKIRAFVDSGAQSTIMSAACVERCGLSRLVDVRYSGEARGVGTGKILGKIHIAQIQLGQSFFPVSITVLESVDVDFLFGLDMLKRHKCCIDLGSSTLRIEGYSRVEQIPFV